MPLYEYRCQKCREVSEFLMKISDPNPTSCPKCGEGPLDKMLSQTSFVLKGTGWYETDFKSKAKKKDDTPATDKGSTSDAKTSETKEAPKPEKKAESSTTSTAKASD